MTSALFKICIVVEWNISEPTIRRRYSNIISTKQSIFAGGHCFSRNTRHAVSRELTSLTGDVSKHYMRSESVYDPSLVREEHGKKCILLLYIQAHRFSNKCLHTAENELCAPFLFWAGYENNNLQKKWTVKITL
jgi:hypothetical protein